MTAVIFEVIPAEGQRDLYLETAADLRPLLDGIDGFLSIERFQSLTDPAKMLSLSFWRDEEAIATWRSLEAHRSAQSMGRSGVFADYRLRIAGVIRDYGLTEREEAPEDSRAFHQPGIWHAARSIHCCATIRIRIRNRHLCSRSQGKKPMFFQLAEVLPALPNRTWELAKQLGVTYAVSGVPVDERGEPTADFLALLRQKERFRQAGIDLVVIETGFPWAQHAKYGGPNAESEIETCCELIRNMGKVGISVVCWNWMAVFNWMRTSLTIPTRGGALGTGYDHELKANAPRTEQGEVSEATLWKNLETFMKVVVPVAEEAGVKLALHPDDPPISPIRGVGRILTNPDAMARAIDLVPSPNNGLTFCQGSFSTMNCDIPAEIDRFSKRGAIHFVHFRDVAGTPARFNETFHDDGQTDMWEAMRAYHRGGFTGPMRPDHVPTMAGEENGNPGYEVLGRLFAIGYIKGLAEGVEKTAN